MNKNAPEVSSDGKYKIDVWLACDRVLRSHRERMKSLESDLKQAEYNLAKWLLPSDAKPGEKIAVWYGDSLIVGELDDANGGKITVRDRGGSLLY